MKMTKFELPEKPKKTNTSEDFNNLRKAVDELDKFDYAWKTYANKADRRINAANKHIEELEQENQRLKADYNNQAESILSMLDEIKSLKSQLQQQALPVVPECVARDIEKLKSFNKDGKNFHIFDLSYYSEESINWVEYDYDNYVKFYLAVATGKYEVEKPQMFYLKNKITESYLYYDEATKLYSDIVGNVEDFFGTKTKFTQSEIDSMQTGSYEQIEVK